MKYRMMKFGSKDNAVQNLFLPFSLYVLYFCIVLLILYVLTCLNIFRKKYIRKQFFSTLEGYLKIIKNILFIDLCGAAV